MTITNLTKRAMIAAIVASAGYLAVPQKALGGIYNCCGDTVCGTVNRDKPCTASGNCTASTATCCMSSCNV